MTGSKPLQIYISCCSRKFFISLSLSHRPSQSEGEEGGADVEREPSPFSRKGSGMVKEFISRTPHHSPSTDDGTYLDHSGTEEPKENGTGTEHGHFQHTHSADSETERHSNKPDAGLEEVASELHHSQDDLVSSKINRGRHSTGGGGVMGSEGGASCWGAAGSIDRPTRELAASAPTARAVPLIHSRDSYRELLTILEDPADSYREDLLSPTPPQFRPKLDTIVCSGDSSPNKPKGHGFLTIQRRAKNQPLSRDQHEFSRMSESYGYEGPPSPLLHDRFGLPQRREGGGEGRKRGEGAEGEEEGGRGREAVVVTVGGRDREARVET